MDREVLETQVTIVGGGPAGLSIALELGLRKIRCVVVEPDPRTQIVPRAKLANVRTMEHARRWGIADEIRQASSLPASFSTDISFVTTLDGHEITRFENVFHTAHLRDERFAEPAQQIPQFQLEPVIRERAGRLGYTTFLTGSRVTGFEQDERGVRTSVCDVDGRESHEIRSDFLVGADGARSFTREHLGIGVGGTRGIARNYGLVFRAPRLQAAIDFAPALHYWVCSPVRPSFMGPLDQDGMWWLQATALPDDFDMASADPRELLAEALSVDIDFEVVATDPWEAHALLADEVRDGRCFLIGDAAHVHTPMGAHGMNLGIGDSADLGWKLAAVLDGWAGDSLLDTYALERIPLHERVLEEATQNYAKLPNHFVRDGLGADGSDGAELRASLADLIHQTKQREFSSLGLVLGHGYGESPTILAEDEAAPVDDVVAFQPVARAGFRAPHAWLADGSSLFDHFGDRLTLLTRGETDDVVAIKEAGLDNRIPLTTYELPAEVGDDIYPQQLALVRPDQMLAWTGDELRLTATELLRTITARSAVSATKP